ncbi:MAG: DEAD/DEAH box helicase [Desulfobacteraceae bacterium]
MDRIGEYIQALLASRRFKHQVVAHHYVTAKSGSGLELGQAVSGKLQPALLRLGIQELYEHQVEALNAIRHCMHTMVATDTASGKSLIYNMALFDALVRQPDARGLYIYPLKALTRDQLVIFNQWCSAVPDIAAAAAVYDGDTSAYRRKKIRSAPPSVLMTNPEMVHLALLPHHAKWETFFRNLKFVVIDEIHVYKGILGGHMSGLMRRFHRICKRYHADPTYIFTSATVANPGHLAEQITGLPVQTITKSAAPRGGRHMTLINPEGSTSQAAILLLKAALARNLRTIVYVRSRKMAELIAVWVQSESGALADKISVYRAGLLPEERRNIEQRLKDGNLLAVVTTSALELGIDIGDLDVCILVGYPGSMVSTWQRSGRVGRKGQEAAVIMIAGQDALDQYYVANPKAFFKGRPEPAMVNPNNEKTLDAHLICAAAEYPLAGDEPWLEQSETAPAVERLVRSGELIRTADGGHLHSRKRRPHLDVHLRSAGQRYRIVHDDTLIGEINAYRLYREAHPGAIYLHRGGTYQVVSVDQSGQCVEVQPASVDYYTRIRADSDVAILEIENSIIYENLKVYIGKVKVTDQVTGYERVATATGRSLQRIPLDVPAVVYSTDAVWWVIDAATCHAADRAGHDLLGTLHAAEHAIIGVMPIVVLADRNDIGGLATPCHPQTGSATIFIYDGLPGGAGFSRMGFQRRRELLNLARDAVIRCHCDEGCPACIHSPKCGSGNHPMDKAGAINMLSHISRPGKSIKRIETPSSVTRPGSANAVSRTIERYGVFDLETQRSASEVGGWHLAHRMKISCGVVYDSGDDTYAVYHESDVPKLIAHLRQLGLVVGFNSKRFDYRVLSGYSDFPFERLPSLDLLEKIHKQLGFRLSLNHLAKQTLQVEKAGSGLDALRWWQQGRLDKIVEYCRMDVKITRDLFLFARDQGYLIYRQKNGDRMRVPITVS